MESVFENKNYKVVLGDDKFGYSVINKTTGQTERREGLLILALNLAADANEALEKFYANEEAKDRTIVSPSEGILVPKH